MLASVSHIGAKNRMSLCFDEFGLVCPTKLLPPCLVLPHRPAWERGELRDARADVQAQGCQFARVPRLNPPSAALLGRWSLLFTCGDCYALEALAVPSGHVMVGPGASLQHQGLCGSG